MTRVTLRVIGGLDLELSGRTTMVEFPDGAAVRDIPAALLALGIDCTSRKYLVALNGLGLNQHPQDQALKDGDALLAIPPLMGG